MAKKQSFFYLFKRIATTPDAGIELLDVSMIRAIFHFMIVIFLSALFVTIARVPQDVPIIMDSVEWFSKNVGDIEVKGDGIYGASNPLEIKKTVLSGDVALLYVPKHKFDENDTFLDDHQKGIVWCSGGIFLWNKEPYGVTVFPFIMGLDKEFSMFLSFKNIDEFKEYIKKNIMSKKGFRGVLPPFNSLGNIEDESTKFSTTIELHPGDRYSLITLGYIMTTLWVLFGLFVGMAIQVLVSSFFFSLFFTIINTTLALDKTIVPSFKSLFIICTYTGFPVILVASCFPAFQLPFLEFQTVYFLGFLIYMFVVFSRVQNHLRGVKNITLK